MIVRILAWGLYAGPSLIQLGGLAAIAVAVGALLGWAVGLLVAGIEAVLVGIVLERQQNARKSA